MRLMSELREKIGEELNGKIDSLMKTVSNFLNEGKGTFDYHNTVEQLLTSASEVKFSKTPRERSLAILSLFIATTKPNMVFEDIKEGGHLSNEEDIEGIVQFALNQLPLLERGKEEKDWHQYKDSKILLMTLKMNWERDTKFDGKQVLPFLEAVASKYVENTEARIQRFLLYAAITRNGKRPSSNS